MAAQQPPGNGSQNPPTPPGNNTDFGQNYGDIYGPTENANLLPQPPQQQQGSNQGQISPGYVISPGGGMTGPQINYDELGPYTREVRDEELVQNQLQGLLASDSPYIQQAIRQGERAAANRGALSSSIFAGASQAAAIQAALPIAAQDAQTFSRVESENAAAINNNNLAQMQSETSIAQSLMAANASVSSSRIAANANLQLGEMRIEAEREAQEFAAAQEEFMANLGFGFDTQMAEQQFGYRQQLEEMANQAALDRIGFQGDVNSYLTNQRLRGSFMNTLTGNIFNSYNNLNALGLDQSGFEGASNGIMSTMATMIDLFNSFQGGGFPQIPIGGDDTQQGPPLPGGG